MEVKSVRIQFNINYKKAVEVILWILDKDKTIDLYKLMKVLFHADLVSVNKIYSRIQESPKISTAHKLLSKALLS